MNSGILVGILTGVLWAIVGIVMSRCSRSGMDFKVYFTCNSLFTLLLAAVFYAQWPAMGSGPIARVSDMTFLLVGAGILSAFGLILMQTAMKFGHNGAIWAIGQSALVMPFLWGILVMGEHGNALKVMGVALILAGMALPAFVKNAPLNEEPGAEKKTSWFKLALLSLLLIGSGQVLQSIPSYWKGWEDSAGLRPVLIYAGYVIGGAICVLAQRNTQYHSRSLFLLASGMAILNAASVKLFFVTLDRLGLCGMASLAYPITVGTCIVGFSLYSLLAIREKPHLYHWAGLVATLAGIFALSR